MFVCFIQYTDFFVIIQHNLLSKYFECENLYVTFKKQNFLGTPRLKIYRKDIRARRNFKIRKMSCKQIYYSTNVYSFIYFTKISSFRDMGNPKD